MEFGDGLHLGRDALPFRNLREWAGAIELPRECFGNGIGKQAARRPHRTRRRQVPSEFLQALLGSGGDELRDQLPGGVRVARGFVDDQA